MITINKPHSRDDCHCWQCKVSQLVPIIIGFVIGGTGWLMVSQPIWLMFIIVNVESMLLIKIFNFVCNTNDFRLWWALSCPEWLSRWMQKRRS